LHKSLTSLKFDLDKDEKAMLQVLACDFELILGLVTVSDISMARIAHNQFSSSSGQEEEN